MEAFKSLQTVKYLINYNKLYNLIKKVKMKYS